MPKQIWKIDEFHGGINDNADPRDILNNELAAAENVAVNEMGKIRMMGGVTNTNSSNAPSDADTVAGYGLFTFSSDFSGANTGTPAATTTDYIAVADTNQSSATKIDIAAEGGAFTADKIDLSIDGSNQAASGEVDFYYADGALRVCDTKFTNTNNVAHLYKFIGDINGTNLDRTMMETSTVAVTHSSDWLAFDNSINSPYTSTFEPDEAQSTSSAEYTQTGASGAPISLLSSATTSDASDASVGVIAAGTLNGPVDQLKRVVCNIRVNTGEETGTSKCQYNIKVYVLNGTDTDESNGTLKGSTNTMIGIGSFTAQHSINVATDGANVAVGSSNSWKIILTVTSLDTGVEDVSLLSAVWQKSGSNYDTHTGILKTTKHNFHVALDQPGSDKTGAFGWDEDWQVGMSLIYDDNQESLITVCNQKSAQDENSFQYTEGKRPPDVAIFCAYSTSWSKRITGAVMYMKRLLDKQWYPQFELDFKKGVGKAVFSGKERPVLAQVFGSDQQYIFQFSWQDILEPQLAITYESRTGISHNEKSINSIWKTSCLANRRIYIGNIKTYYEDGSSKIFPDKMVRSLPNKFDIFPISESVDVAINDGEDIIALVEFNDRILQFKDKTLYVINVGQDIEFLEDKLPYRGISHKASVFKTEYGVVWANKNGCFFYDGRKINDLLQKQGRPMIKQSTWESFVGTPLVGYDPRRKQVIVVDDIGASKEGDCYIYDMITQSWVKGVGVFPDTIKSNFAIDSDGKLIYHSHDGSSTSLFKEWTDSATSNDIDNTSLKIRTKDIDFGSPSQKKSVKKVYISYKGNGSGVTVKYFVNGDNDTVAQFYRTTSTGPSDNTNDDATPLLDVGLDDWVCAELKPSAGSVTCNSFGIEIDGTATDATFEVNDISIVYRPKSIK
jgi:hypothetical protein